MILWKDYMCSLFGTYHQSHNMKLLKPVFTRASLRAGDTYNYIAYPSSLCGILSSLQVELCTYSWLYIFFFCVSSAMYIYEKH